MSEKRQYLTGHEVVDDSLGFIAHPEGRWTPSGNPTNLTTYQLEYSLTDHLGNVRVRFKAPAGGLATAADVLAEYHYYPFGMEMKGGWNSSVNSGGRGNLYRYNGKEFSEEIGLYAYGFRYYDPAIGRFTGVEG